MSEVHQPRGIRNNNPSNLRWGVDWLGLREAPERTDPDFCQFVDAWAGIRALALNLLAYQRSHGLNTVAEIIHRWAPATENNTHSYIKDVCDYIGHGPDETLDFSALNGFGQLKRLARAIIHHENGPGPKPDAHWYPDYEVSAAVTAALQYADRHRGS
jgi:hypothetical protein